MATPNVYNSRLDAFDLYHKQQQQASTSILDGPALPALGHAIAGSTGTAISNLALYPLDLVITRLQVQPQLRRGSSPEEGEYKGVLDAFEQIYTKEGGLLAFYTGVLQDTGKSIADSFLFFLFYNYLRTNRLQKKGTKATTLPALDELIVGAVAGAGSKFFTTPISNIVTRKQTASMGSARSKQPSAEPSVSNIVSSICSEKGLQGFWSGYSAGLVLTLNPSITFFLYESFKRTLLPRSRREDPGAQITFLMAAFSKAIASTITYPFSLAKKRAQASSSPPVDPNSANELKTEFPSTSNTSEAKKTSHNAKNLARKSMVFVTVLRIYREEGVEALYEGVWGEIFKGFFSHGITMIVKEIVHKFIIQAYYWILKALDKYPSPTQVAEQARQAVENGVEKTGVMVKGGSTKDAAQASKNTVNDALHSVSSKKVQTGIDPVVPTGNNASANTPNGEKLLSEQALGIR
ncbi:putative peroxisomal adenine nucleotide transporter 1 [Amylocarpus encephaloides]|uniref:Peroxisomal adenine nucleotide transporter 1 n=1 Tax=Amylocarpus encephaloides TaxID=45428 RepID=A0A9P7YQ35_9HELO|nr:putative peroxisomal adenine nucleotide transporter 1 [Amylocarpus encephaloides]